MDQLTTDKLLEEAFEKLKSKLSGAMHAAGQFVKTGNVGLAKTSYSAQSVAKRAELFKQTVGDYLSKIEQFDTTGATKLNTLSHIGPVVIKSKSTVNEPADGQQYTTSAGLTYTYNAKSKSWFDAGGRKMGNSPMMTKKFLKQYPKGVVKEITSLNEAGEVFAYEREIEKQIKSFITDLATQFNVTGNNTKEILTNLEKLPAVPDLKKAVTELNAFINDLGTKTKLTIKLPEVKIAVPAAKPTSAATSKTTSTKAAPAKPTSTSNAPKMGDNVVLGNYKFTFDGKSWISPIDHKPVKDAGILRAINLQILNKKPVSKSKKPVSKKPTSTGGTSTGGTSSTPSGGAPKDGAIDASKKYKFDATKGLWINIATNTALSKFNSDNKTKAYWKAVAAKKIVPEGKTKITYKEFFV